MGPPTESDFAQDYNKHKRRCIERMKRPSTDDSPMDDTLPSCSIANFIKPRLRHCPHDLSSVVFHRYLNKNASDGGLDGYNWVIHFGKGKPRYVLKVLWDTTPWYPHYFAPQRECQNAALFQMMQAAISTPEPGPILVNPEPKTWEDATENLFAFSDEKRKERAAQLAGGATFPDLVPVTEMPRMRRCHGWMRFQGGELLDRVCNPMIQVDYKMRTLNRESEYTAIVYEFVEEGVNDPGTCQPVVDFLWRAGFEFVPVSLEKNWQSNILLDHSEVVHCIGYGWDVRDFELRTWSQILEASKPSKLRKRNL